MSREKRRVYLFISDENSKFYRATQNVNGDYAITLQRDPYPIKYNPINLIESPVEFGTNAKYFSLARSLSYPLDFVKDGAAILRHLYFLNKGTEQKAYLTVIENDTSTGIYDLSYKGKFDFSEKTEDPKAGVFSVPTVDDSAWAVLSKYDTVQLGIDCSKRNPKAVKVLLDGITLVNRYTFQTVKATIQSTNTKNFYVVPFVLVNTEGDSYGIVTANQTFLGYYTTNQAQPELRDIKDWFFYSSYPIVGVNISGTLTFVITDLPQTATVQFMFVTDAGQTHTIFSQILTTDLRQGKVYTVGFDFTMSIGIIAPNEHAIFFVAQLFGQNRPIKIEPIVTNIHVTTKTKQEARVVYGLRAIDLAQQIVAKATKGRYQINSNFLKKNKNDICFSGDAIRGIPNAMIYTSFEDFFMSFDAIYYMAIRSILGELWLEPATEVYKSNSTLIDIGNAIDVKLKPAKEYFGNEIIVGSPNQNYNHPSGRLEFNSQNTFSLHVENSEKKLNFVSKYRLDGFGIQFLIMDYDESSTRDNSGDKEVFVARITDNQGGAIDYVENFENITINAASLNPIIKSPLENDVINFARPLISGICLPLQNVFIYVDNALMGSTVSDSIGNWKFQIPIPLASFDNLNSSGNHEISATFTDLNALVYTINIKIDTTVSCPTLITYPNSLDTLYNNKPLIKGIAQAGIPVAIKINGATVATVIADNSCKWEYKSPVLPVGSNTISINNGTDTVIFDVDTNLAYALITYVGGELDGFEIANNLPLVQGIALPNTVVTLWLNYISQRYLGQTTSDVNGNWSIQVVPVMYTELYTGSPIILAPIQNGLNIFSTSLQIQSVGIKVRGYLLDRPVFSSINGVTDNTVFNTFYRPKNMLKNHYPLISAIMNQQRKEIVEFQTASKNGNFSTVLNGVFLSENTNIPISDTGTPIAMLELIEVRTFARKSFIKTLEDFNNGGVIKTNFRGNDLLALPIGNMKMKSIVDDVQEWELLLAPNNSYLTLLNLYKNGLNINIKINQMYHSDFNTLHLVQYNFQPNTKYQNINLYQDWFENRNEPWSTNPKYIQKLQRSETFRDQIITNGITNISLQMYSCFDGLLVHTFPYSPVTPAPIPPPDVVLEAVIDLSLFPEGVYFFVLMTGTKEAAISEKIHSKNFWPKTFLIEASSSINQTGVFFSTGFKTVIRVEGTIKKFQPEILATVGTDERRDSTLLYGITARSREVRFGTAYGLPDYLYLKIADAIALDNLKLDNEGYTIQSDKINISDDIDGHPLYYYTVVMEQTHSERGLSFSPPDDSELNRPQGVALVVDASAFGLPVGSLINIALENE